ncbi:MAG: cysteine--tRNA ligase [Ignisphaera sp.]
MSIKIYNTLTRSVEPFQPLSPPIIKAYFCGPTVYDHTHLGHVRAYLAFDFIKRYLKLRGYTFIHVQNITDIDDKIIKRANDEGVSWREIVDRYTKEYLDVLTKLGIVIDIHPKVTEHIKEIIEFIEKLIEKGHAYVAPSGSVYFDVSTVSDYGKLSKRFKSEEWRQEEEFLAEKRNPYDFALWKAAKPGEPWWESPWGRGRPGWHTECAVMSSRYLGTQFDIHGGGQDLIFPHHENEIAMAEAVYGVKPWVKYWIHVGYLTIRGEKMSKSLGNVITAKEAIEKFSPEVLRLWVFSAHYRKQLEFDENILQEYKVLYQRLVTAIENLRNIIKSPRVSHYLTDEDVSILSKLEANEMMFHDAMSNDFNTPKALEAVNNVLSMVFKDVVRRETYELALRAYSILANFNTVLGVLDKYLKEKITIDLEFIEKLVDIIIRVRAELRKKKEYELSDRIRQELLALGIKVFDYKDESKWVWER